MSISEKRLATGRIRYVVSVHFGERKKKTVTCDTMEEAEYWHAHWEAVKDKKNNKGKGFIEGPINWLYFFWLCRPV